MGKFSIRVINQRGRPCPDVTVFISYGIWKGSEKDYTNRNGWVEFDNLSGELEYGTVYIHDKKMGTIKTNTGSTHSFTIDWD
jgi:hypothetical protein